MRNKSIFSYLLIVLMLVASFLPPLSVQANQESRYNDLSVRTDDPISNNYITEINSPTYVSPELPIIGEMLIDVIVELRERPIVVEKFNTETKGKFFSQFRQQTVEHNLAIEKQEFFQHLKERHIGVEILKIYKTIFNGTSIQVKANQIPLLANLDEVKGIYPVVTYRALTETPTTYSSIDSSEVTPSTQSLANSLIGVPELANLGLTGADVKVGVIDTGIDYHHPDLAAAYKGGYDFVDNDDDPYETTPSDIDPNQQTTHGTHVAGIIASQAIQENGMLGVAPGVKLYAYRVLGPSGVGRTDWVLAGIEKAVEDEMDIINLSLGSFFNDSDHPTAVALNNAMLAGTLAVVAAGNSGPSPWTVCSPGTSTMALTVGATTVPEPDTEEIEQVWNLSSRGPVKNSLQLKPDLMAPGVLIRSTIAAYETDYTNAYASFSGTSMATPHVVGVVALLKEAYPNLTSFDLKALVMNNGKRIGSTGQYMLIDQGAGRIQASKAFHAPFLAQVVEQISYLYQGNTVETENIASSISFGEVTLEKSETLEKTIQLLSLANVTQQLTITTEFLNDNHQGLSITTDIEQLNLEPQINPELQVKLNVDHETASSGKYEGYLLISNENGHSIQLPFLFFVGEYERAKGFEKITVSPTDFSLNTNTELIINIEVNSQMHTQELFIWDGEQYIGQIFYYSGETVLPPGKHNLNWNGSYFDFQTEKTKFLADGDYTIDFLGWDDQTIEDQPYIVWASVYMKSIQPQIIYHGETTIELGLEESTYVINGKVEDKYVDLGKPEKLTVKYELKSEMENDTEPDTETTIQEGIEAIADNGDFTIELEISTNKNKRLYLFVEDAAGNVSESLQIIFEEQVADPPVNEPTPNPPAGGGGGFVPTPEPTPEPEEEIEEEIVKKPLVQPISTFKDYDQIKKITWAAQAIERLVNLQVLEGNNGYFNPENAMTREEFAKVIVFVLDLHKPVATIKYDKVNFSDIQESRWSAPFISIAAENGLLEGKRINGRLVFDPRTPITRAEMAVVLTRAFNLQISDHFDVTPFNDTKEHWARKHINAVYQQGLVQGIAPNAYAPNQDTTRAEMAVFLTRVLDFKK